MTHEEIMALSPEELRIKIAEALGYKVINPMDSHSSIYPKFLSGEWDIVAHQTIAYKDGVGHTVGCLPDWPNDIAAAWGLAVEAGIVVIHVSDDDRYIAGISDGAQYPDGYSWFEIETTDWVIGDTAPLAICRAWLLWKSQ
jgi:hypothetical protein